MGDSFLVNKVQNTYKDGLLLCSSFSAFSTSERRNLGREMGQKLGGLWSRVQGAHQMQMICDMAFDQCIQGNNEKDLLALNELHRATLLVYNALNRYFPGYSHMEPPSSKQVRDTVEDFRRKNIEALDREQFHQMIVKWTSKHLRRIAITKIGRALMAAPAMTQMTKHAAKRINPRIGNAVEKIPSPVLMSAYTIGFVLLQDVRVRNV